jgi:hypothetical protein
MEPNSREALPELPRPEHVDPRVDDIELVASPEQQESEPLRETLIRANDAVSQSATASAPVSNDNDYSTTAIPLDDNPAIADDVDVIEKEWVQKAKQIVTETKNDPRSQSVRINVYKHDYIKKRYGKDIKLPEDQKGS